MTFSTTRRAADAPPSSIIPLHRRAHKTNDRINAMMRSVHIDENHSAPHTLPFLSVNFPVQTLIRSISQLIPRQPPVHSQMIPVPVFPAINLCTPSPPRKNVINIAFVFVIVTSSLSFLHILSVTYLTVIKLNITHSKNRLFLTNRLKTALNQQLSRFFPILCQTRQTDHRTPDRIWADVQDLLVPTHIYHIDRAVCPEASLPRTLNRIFPC